MQAPSKSGGINVESVEKKDKRLSKEQNAELPQQEPYKMQSKRATGTCPEAEVEAEAKVQANALLLKKLINWGSPKIDPIFSWSEIAPWT